MRVLHVLNDLTPSGAEVMLRVAARHWGAAGVESELISLGQELGEYAPSLAKEGYTIHHLPYAPTWRFLRDFRRHLVRHRYDVVHLHPERGNLRLGLVIRSCGLPCLRSIHHPFPFEGAEGRRRRAGRALLRASGVLHVSVSESIEAWEREHFRNPTVLIHNWYDSVRFIPPSPEERSRARDRLMLAPDRLVLLTVGNCRPYKNHPALFEALGQLSSDLSFHYLHIGQETADGQEREQARRLGIDNRVSFLGFQDDIVPYLHAADVFVMPSLGEGLGIAVIEALAAGLITILADVPGIRDHKALSNEILWVAPTPPSLVEALLRVSAMPVSERERIQKSLGNAARQRHGVERGVSEYASWYARLM